MTDDEWMAAMRRRAARYEEIKHLSAGRITFVSGGYARNTYRVVLDEETSALSDQDLVLLCDSGNACFGGKVGPREGESVEVAVYTD